MCRNIYGLLGGFIIAGSALMFATSAVNACTRILWNTNPGLIIVANNEDYVTVSHSIDSNCTYASGRSSSTMHHTKSGKLA